MSGSQFISLSGYHASMVSGYLLGYRGALGFLSFPSAALKHGLLDDGITLFNSAAAPVAGGLPG